MNKKKKMNLKKPETQKTKPRIGRSPKAVEIVVPEDKREQEAALAKTYLRPTVLAAATIKGQYVNEDNININALIDELSSQVALVKEGNMGRAEAMLVTQAHTLDSLFAELISRARMNMGQYMDATHKYFNMALKAQSQCRCTIEALVEIKNPRPVAFIRQQNVGENVQVNNGERPQSIPHTRAGENQKLTNGLLEDKRHETEWLDSGAPETAGGNDKELETVGAQYRAENR